MSPRYIRPNSLHHKRNQFPLTVNTEPSYDCENNSNHYFMTTSVKTGLVGVDIVLLKNGRAFPVGKISVHSIHDLQNCLG